MPYIMVLLLTALQVAAPASAAALSCPPFAPTEWKVPGARLTAVRVLSHPAEQTLVEGDPLPLMAPFDEVERKGVLHQTWNMNVDGPNYSYLVDCLYTGTPRYLRMPAPDVKTCIARLGLRRKSFAFSCR